MLCRLQSIWWIISWFRDCFFKLNILGVIFQNIFRFQKMKMTKYVFYYCALPSIISFIIGTGFSFFWRNQYNGQEIEQLIIVDLQLLLFCILLMSVLSLTILLNKFQVVRKFIILNIVSWFIPLSFPILIIFYSIERYNYTKDNTLKYTDVILFTNDFIMDLIVFTPYILGAIVSFVIFRTSLMVQKK